jgi:hypothetical protein
MVEAGDLFYIAGKLCNLTQKIVEKHAISGAKAPSIADFGLRNLEVKN